MVVCSLEKKQGPYSGMEDAVFIDREKHWKGRKIKEALYINAQNPKKTVDKNSIMNVEKGMDMHPIWGDFNEKFRNIMSKKFQRGV